MNVEGNENTQSLDPEHELPAGSPCDLTAEEVQKIIDERDSLRDKWIRTAAEADNFRKRSQRELQEARVFATGEAVRPFLVVLDGFERALHHTNGKKPDAGEVRKGLELLHRQLQDAAREVGLEPVEALGQPFDPHVHEAIEMVPTDEAPEGHVVEELQRGYRLRERLIRPAMVKVAAKKG
ncbi:MAG TPA: nucleotide exchange factor GrpE [Terriglobales bacterium]